MTVQVVLDRERAVKADRRAAGCEPLVRLGIMQVLHSPEHVMRIRSVSAMVNTSRGEPLIVHL